MKLIIPLSKKRALWMFKHLKLEHKKLSRRMYLQKK